MKERIAIASDHAGYELKYDLLEYLRELGYEAEDLGTNGPESVDYPDYGRLLAERVVSGGASRGVVICGTGIGVSIAANKVRGARAALCTNVFMAEMSRRHNDSNILALGGRVLSAGEARPILRAWLETGFEGGRHALRLQKITEIEESRGCC
jgi:ribose 5-phosphate isomerase B